MRDIKLITELHKRCPYGCGCSNAVVSKVGLAIVTFNNISQPDDHVCMAAAASIKEKGSGL